jgi:hypothetical protein
MCLPFTQTLVLVFAAVFVATSTPAAQTVQRPSAALGGASEVQCTFKVYATGAWRLDEPTAQVQPSKLSVVFKEIDVQDGIATAVGPFGASTIIARLSSGNLHLLEMATSGALYVTTVFPKELRDGRLRAVHTRHEYTDVSLPGFTSRPEQYYGDCAVLPKPGVPR